MNEITTQLSNKKVVQRFAELLGEKKANQFVSSALSIVKNSDILQKAEASSIINSLAIAASLDLPINPNLGFAYLVPYKGQCSFQIGYKGLVQLAQRSGQYLRLNVVEVYENQYKGFNALTEELDADFTIDGLGKIVGYVAYFKMLNGFEKLVYWSAEKVTAHAKKYSQSFGKSFSPWADKDQFHEMAKKTVLKNTLSRWGSLTTEMQTATLADQSVPTEDGEFEYVDNQPPTPEEKAHDEEVKRMAAMISKAKTDEEKEMLKDSAPDLFAEAMEVK